MATPLVKKLGLKGGQRACFLNAPPSYRASLGAVPDGVMQVEHLDPQLDFIQFFARDRATLEQQFPRLKRHLAPAGMVWICWPKRASGLDTDLTREAVRAIGLNKGLVDVKVCAIDEDWSGLKFVYRLVDR